MESDRILSILLAMSVLLNAGLILFYVPAEQEQIGSLITRTNLLTLQNMQLEQQLSAANLSLRGSSCPADLSRSRPALVGTDTGSSPPGMSGTASMTAPAVSQSVRLVRNGPFIEQVMVMNGSTMNISVTAQPGRGRVLVETKPLMGIIFQDAANTAVSVAQNRTGIDLGGTDIFFSIEADKEVSAVDGSSAGGLMALLAIAALEHRAIDPAVTLTGTIDENGHVGAIGGIVEKATAAKEHGITRFLLPRENSMLTVYDRQAVNYHGFQLIDYVTRRVETKTYLAKNVGITADYVDSIDDVIAVAVR